MVETQQPWPRDAPAPTKIGRRLNRIAFLLLVVTPIALVVIAILSRRGKPAYRVSRETTYLTEPVVNGQVDYVAALNEEGSQGITPENNAVVLLIQAVGPRDIPVASRGEYFERLGIAVLPETGDYFVPSGQIIQSDRDAWKRFKEVSKTHRAWQRHEYPLVAEWLDRNHNALERVIAATKRDRFFDPLMVSPDAPQPSYGSWVALRGASRGVARALLARATLALGAGDFDTAQRDLHACHRLARLTSQNPEMIETLVAYAIEATACRGDALLVTHRGLSRERAIAYRARLRALPAMTPIVEKVDHAGRIEKLEALASFIRERHAVSSKGHSNGKPWIDENVRNPLLDSVIGWDVIFENLNKTMDRAVDAICIEDHAEQQAALDRLEADARRRYAAQGRGSFVMGPRETATEYISSSSDVGVVSYVQARSNRDRLWRTRMQLIDIALSLAAHRAEQGEFPDRLGALVPGSLDEIPVDLFSGEPLLYERTETGYVLYSVGPNGIDEGGRGVDDTPRGDDVAVKSP